MKIFSWLIGLILLLLSLTFAVSNRQNAVISLWPFDMQVEAPLYLLTLGVLLFGLLLGASFAWISMLPHRFESRRLHKDIGMLHDKLEELQQSIVPSRLSGEISSYMSEPKRNWRFWKRRT